MDGNFHINYWTDNVSYLNQRSVRLRVKNGSNVSIVQAKYDIQPYIKAKEARANGQQVLVVIMNKNKKSQKEQLTKDGYEEFVEFFNK